MPLINIKKLILYLALFFSVMILSSCGTIGYGIALMESISDDLYEASNHKTKK